LLTSKNRANLDIVAQGRFFPSIKEILQVLVTFGLTVFAWIFFRAESLSHAFAYIKGIFTSSLISMPTVWPIPILILLLLFILMEWIGREQKYALQFETVKWNRPIRWSVYLFIVFLIGNFMVTEETPFIYFQF